jgi:hypothetical protein
MNELNLLRDAFLRFVRKDDQIDREIARRLDAIAAREHELTAARQSHQLAQVRKLENASYLRATRALWLRADEPVVGAHAALELQEWFTR